LGRFSLVIVALGLGMLIYHEAEGFRGPTRF
jgi:hypothetical protein